MAKLAHNPLPFPSWFEAKCGEAQTKALDQLQARSLLLPEDAVVGGVLAFPVADGYAHYLVIADNPLTVQHIPYADEYSVEPSFIAEMDREFVMQELAMQRKLAEPRTKR